MWFVDGFFLVLSNVAFLIPSLRAVEYRRWTRAAIFLLILVNSSLYHACRSYSDFCVLDFHTLQKMDFVTAYLTIPLNALYLINFKVEYQWIERWIIIFYVFAIFLTNAASELISTTSTGAFLFGSIFAVLIPYYVFFEVPSYDKVMLQRGAALILLSISLFITQGRYVSGYGFTHSIWHVLGALGTDYLLRIKPKAPVYAAMDKQMRYFQTGQIKAIPYF